MKTALSLPDDIFNEMEKVSAELGISRSELYRRAALEFLERHKGQKITEILNEVYGQEDSSLEPELAKMQYVSVNKEPRETW